MSALLGVTATLVALLPATGAAATSSDVSGMAHRQLAPARTPGSTTGARSALALPPGRTDGQSGFLPVAPVRLLDTRSGLGAPASPVGAGGTLDLQIAGTSGIPMGATAVVLNVTATGASGPTDVRAYPSDASSVPTVSNLNVRQGGTVANQVTVALSADGRVRLRNAAGTVQLVADLTGAYSPTAGSSFVPAAPRRLLDTRASGSPLPAQEPRLLSLATDVTGQPSGVPAAATAVVLNVTAVGPTASTDVRVYPSLPGGAVPEVSNLNATAGSTVPNLVTVAVGVDGAVALRSSAGTVHLVADLAGWFVPGVSGAALRPIEPQRLLDTRQSGGRLGPGEARELQIAGIGTTFPGGPGRVPGQAVAAVLNVTAVGATAPSDVRVYPAADGLPPLVSNLNVVAGSTVPNAVVVQVGRDGAVRLRNASGSVHLVVDLAGWYIPSGDGWDVSWPQCTSAGATTSRVPVGGAFSVVGLTRGRPLTDNECFAAQWRWASTLPGEPSVYLNVNAPGPRSTPDGVVWQQVCGTGQASSVCGRQYGELLARYALARLPSTPSGGRPVVWLDVEGPYAGGPFWQTGYAGAVAVNRAVLTGAIETLRAAGYRVGIYSERASSSFNDWVAITGGWRLEQAQNWLFRAPSADPAPLCRLAESATGGPVVMVQVQPQQSGQAYDVNHAC